MSSGASALSRYIDALCDNKMRDAFKEYMPINISGIAEYPDFLAFGFVMLITGIHYTTHSGCDSDLLVQKHNFNYITNRFV